MICGRTVIVLVSVTALALLCGCSSSGPTGPTDDELLKELVQEPSRRYSDKTVFDSLFAEGAALTTADRQAFSMLYLEPKTTEITGGTATIAVLVGTNHPDATYTEETLTWEATKVGDAWKLSKAPIK